MLQINEKLWICSALYALHFQDGNVIFEKHYLRKQNTIHYFIASKIVTLCNILYSGPTSARLEDVGLSMQTNVVL